MRRTLFTLLALIGAASMATVAKANSVAFYVVTTGNPATATSGTWQVYADVSQDNDGLSAYDLDILATGGVSLTGNASNKAPQPVDPSGQYGGGSVMGFNLFNSNGARTAGAGGSITSITSAQNTTYGASDDPTFDMGVLVGVGQENSSASPQDGTQGPTDGSGIPTGLAEPVWSYVALGPHGAFNQVYAGTLIEQGAYTSNAAGGTISVALGGGGTGFVETLNDAPANVPWVDQGVSISGFTGGSVNILTSVPEPASIGLIVLGMGMLSTGRRIRKTA